MEKDINNLLTRVEYFENIFDDVNEKIQNLSNALEEYAQIIPKINELEEYYENGQWQNDYIADEEGKIPQNIKRGVLSEDGLYNLLMENDEIKALIK